MEEIKSERIIEKRYNFILKNLQKGVILDLGCAYGNLHQYLLTHTNNKYKIIGVDCTSQSNLGRWKLTLDDVKNVDIDADLNKKFPFQNNFADTIVVGDTLEHMDNPPLFLRDCQRVLKPMGNLIITTPSMNALRFIFDKNIPSIQFLWNEKSLRSILEKSGFIVEKIFYCECWYNRNIFFRLITYFCLRFRSHIFVVCKKKNKSLSENVENTVETK